MAGDLTLPQFLDQRPEKTPASRFRPGPFVQAALVAAASVVERFEPFRAPHEPDELARRTAAGLNAAQQRNLERWGYPYVFDEFRFHMTLTGPIAPVQWDAALGVLQERFGALLADPIELDALALFVQAESGADFLVHARHPLQGRA